MPPSIEQLLVERPVEPHMMRELVRGANASECVADKVELGHTM